MLQSNQSITICLKEKKEIPIIQMKDHISINELEKKATQVASFLNIPIRER